ncbi:MAG: TonB-dependent receptor, partial [Gammaproteobacteria bacterium]|nr:TonB-dependent receptor [Gammaproteobacteria bacterium]
DYRMTATVTAGLSFAYAKHRYDNNPALSTTPLKGNDIDTAPETLGAATLLWIPSESFNMELEWVHIGDYYEDPQNLHHYEGHDLLHLRSSWRFSESLEMTLRVMNLTDEDYADRADYSFGSDRYFVGTPLSVYLGLEVDF